MERFIGTKIVYAEPMTRGEYNLFRGWQIPADENPDDPGYKVVYSDDYVSWSPAAAFDEAYRRADGMPFGLALEAVKKGAKVARRGWNGKDMFICNGIVEQFATGADISSVVGEDGAVETLPFLMMKTADNKMCIGWLASQTDMLADDWYIVDFEPVVIS